MNRSLARIFAATALALAAAGSAHASQTFLVNAQANSTAFVTHDANPLDTGLQFTVGDAIDITASGTWGGGGCGDSVGPTGTTCFGVDPVTGIDYFSLIGRVGGGSWFLIGDAYSGAADATGHLFLAFDDTDSFNNHGDVTAVVATSAVPEPGSLSLLLAGVGVLGVAARRRAKSAA